MSKKTPIAVLLTDTHHRDGNEELVESIFDQAFDLCDKLGINTIIHAGDWFQYRSMKFESSLKCFLSVEKIIQKATDRHLFIHTIQGNHDKPNLLSEKGYLSILKNAGALVLFENEGVEIIGNIIFCFLPYFKEGVDYLSRLLNLIELLRPLQQKNKNFKAVLITHAAIDGVANTDGTVVSGEAAVEYFGDFDLVLSGHYHAMQTISDNIIYFGSAYQSNFGEDENKGLRILYSDLSIEYIQSNFPKYIKVHINIDEQGIQALYNELEDQYNNLNVNDKFQVVLHGKEDNLAKIDRNDTKLKGLDIRHQAIERDIPFDSVEDAEVVVFDKKNIAKSWMEYAKQNDVPADMRSKGLKLLTTMRL